MDDTSTSDDPARAQILAPITRDALRARRREERTEVGAVGESEQRRPFDVGIIEHRFEIGHEHFDRREFGR